MNSRKWNIIVFSTSLFALLGILIFNYVIDPFLHYRSGFGNLQYPLKEERYINDGMQRNFDYQVLVTGTSMSWNFSPSLFDELLGISTLKTAYSGAHFHELAQNMSHAISHNPDLKMIICSLDPNVMVTDPYSDAYEDTPVYLYDDNPLNDVSYLLNKDVLTKSIAVINYTRAGNVTVSRDDYGRFDLYMPSGRDAVLGSYVRQPVIDTEIVFGNEDKEIVYENITQNFITIAKEYPDVTFNFYIPPYSYCYWDAMVRTGQLQYVLDIEEYAVGLLLEEENIRVYAFDDMISVTTNLDNYTDTLHYVSDVCNIITERICNDQNRLTKQNYIEYFDTIGRIYSEMDYDL